MRRKSDDVMFRLAMSLEDWVLIDNALTAYSHNAAYRDVREWLDMQVAIARVLSGASQSAKVSNARRPGVEKAPSRR